MNNNPPPPPPPPPNGTTRYAIGYASATVTEQSGSSADATDASTTYTGTSTAGNPLVKHLRQPKIYIKLPSEGHYWPSNALEKTQNGEYPVYAMTAKDEITFKTPDALLNGQATVDVIQSCIPNIKDAWQTPSIDLDAILVAIRMASFGEKIDMSAQVPERYYKIISWFANYL